MEEARNNFRRQLDKGKINKKGYSRSTTKQKESPLCCIDGHMSPQKRGVRTQITEVQRQSRAPWWHCERRLWSLRSFFWTGLVCVSNDCRKSNGCYCKTTRLWRTSSWCSVCLHPCKIGGRSQIARNSKVRMSRRMDTSSTTQMA